MGDLRDDPRYVEALSLLPDDVVEAFHDEIDAVFILTGPTGQIVPALLVEADRAQAEGRATAPAWAEFTRSLVDHDLEPPPVSS